MSLWDDVQRAFGDVMDWIKDAIDWIGKPENRETVGMIYGVIIVIAKAVGLLNEAIPKRDRPKIVRTVVEVIQKLSDADLAAIREAKLSSELDKLTSGQLDIICGHAIGGYVEVEKAKTKRDFMGGRKP